MCEDCGCSEELHATRQVHDYGGRAELARNDRLAERNRGFLQAKQVFAVNVLSFGASGAHAMLERTVTEYGRRRNLVLLTGARLEALGALHGHGVGPSHEHSHSHEALPAADPVDRAHIDAHAIGHALGLLALDTAEVLLIENGGSAACQAVYDLGEAVRVAVFSVREGAAKPLKFPLFFEGAAAAIVTETSQATAAGFDRERARENLRKVAPGLRVLDVDGDTGAGLDEWYAFLDEGVKRTKAHAF